MGAIPKSEMGEMPKPVNRWYIESVRRNQDGSSQWGHYCIHDWYDPFKSRKEAHDLISWMVKDCGGHFHWDVNPPKGYDFVYSVYGVFVAIAAKCAPYIECEKAWIR